MSTRGASGPLSDRKLLICRSAGHRARGPSSRCALPGPAFSFVAAFDEHAAAGNVAFHGIRVAADPDGRAGSGAELALQPKRVIDDDLGSERDDRQIVVELHDLDGIAASF